MGLKKNKPSHLSVIIQKSHFLMKRPNTSQPAISIYQFLKDVAARVLFAECYLEIFLSVLAAGIPLLGCVSFYHQIKRTQVC